MPVAHIGLAVSNLPASTAFFLVALGPLGYHYIGARGDQIGFGVREADFFLSPIDRGSVLLSLTLVTDRLTINHGQIMPPSSLPHRLPGMGQVRCEGFLRRSIESGW